MFSINFTYVAVYNSFAIKCVLNDSLNNCCKTALKIDQFK